MRLNNDPIPGMDSISHRQIRGPWAVLVCRTFLGGGMNLEIQNNKIDSRIEITWPDNDGGIMVIKTFSYHTEMSRDTEAEARQKAELWIKAAKTD